MPPTRRVQVRDLPQAPRIQPRARPVDTFVRPPQDTGLSRLASSLEQFQPSLNRFLAEKEEAQDEQEAAQAIKDFQESDKEYREAIRKGEIEPGGSPHYRRAWREQELRLQARNYREETRQAFLESDVRGQDDPDAVANWLRERSQNYTKSYLSAFPDTQLAEVFLPAQQAANDELLDQWSDGRVEAYEESRWTQTQQEITGLADDVINGEGTTQELGQALTALKNSFLQTDPTKGKELNALTSEMIARRAVETGNRKLLSSLQHVQTGPGGKLSDTAVARQWTTWANGKIDTQERIAREEAIEAETDRMIAQTEADLLDRDADAIINGDYSTIQDFSLNTPDGETETFKAQDRKDAALQEALRRVRVFDDEGNLDQQRTFRRQATILSRSGTEAVNDTWESILEGGWGSVDFASELTPETNPAFFRGLGMYQTLMGIAPNVARRHMSEKAENAYRDTTMLMDHMYDGDVELASKHVLRARNQLEENGGSLSAPQKQEVNKAVRSLQSDLGDRSWLPFDAQDVDNSTTLNQAVDLYVRQHVQLGFGSEKALKLAKKRIEEGWTVVRGQAVRTGTLVDKTVFPRSMDHAAQRYFDEYGEEVGIESPSSIVPVALNPRGTAWALANKETGMLLPHMTDTDENGVPWGQFNSQNIGQLDAMRAEQARREIEAAQAENQQNPQGDTSHVPRSGEVREQDGVKPRPEFTGKTTKDRLGELWDRLPEVDPKAMPGPGPASERQMPENSRQWEWGDSSMSSEDGSEQEDDLLEGWRKTIQK